MSSTRDDFTVFDGQVMSIGGGIKNQVTWKIRTYMYATRVDPRKPDDYAKHGGETYMIIVHSGSVHLPPMY
ncbi:hypothetical protein HGRIS_000035 [Hohenbuehelia grisea]|uniref:Uncharacterized protein n=1 Tax=Hohenbuehelia grisea TaxID=104357 RepID=A0ABR3JS00_9AGAR